MSALTPPLIIIPCYNEEETLPTTIQTLVRLVPEAHLLCIDDGSTDNTWEIIRTQHGQNPTVKGLKLTHNFGQQEALLTGLFWAQTRYPCAITIDADLQDDPALILQMLEQFHKGTELVLAVRKDRQADSPFKKWSAALFYMLCQKRLLPQHGDFRLMSQAAIKKLLLFKPERPFLRSWVLQLGIPYKILYFSRRKRTLGTSKYSLKKMVALALRISKKPLKQSLPDSYPFPVAMELI